MKICRVVDCDKPRYNRHRLCSMHLSRWRRLGSLDLPVRPYSPKTSVLEDAVHLVDGGERVRSVIAERIGVQLDTLDRALYRARRRGDEQAARILARTERSIAA